MPRIVLPDRKDPRLRLAAVIITLQVLGQTVLGFRVSIAQILLSILACSVVEIALTFALLIYTVELYQSAKAEKQRNAFRQNAKDEQMSPKPSASP